MTGTVWITGSSGFSGHHLIEFLQNEHPKVRIVAIDVASPPRRNVDAFQRIDLASSADVAALAEAEPPQWVIHLAGLMPPADETAMWKANVGGTLGLLVGLRRGGAVGTRVVGIGSAAEYAPQASSPLSEDSPCGGASAYGDTKLAQTLVTLSGAAAEGLSTTVARPFNLVGPGLAPHLVAGAMVRQFKSAANGDSIRVGNTHTARDFIDVRDAVRAYWRLATDTTAGGIYNVCSGQPVTIERLLGLLADITAKTLRIECDPERVRSNDSSAPYGTPGRLREAVGWTPCISLERSLRDMLACA